VNGLAAIAGSTLVGAAAIWVILFFVGAAVLLYSATATAFLALRVGQVRQWTSAVPDPKEIGTRKQSLALHRAVETCVSSHRNAVVLRDPVGYLRDAQAYALIAVISVAFLAMVSTGASVTKSQAPDRGLPSASPALVRSGPSPYSSPTTRILPTP